MTAVPPPLPDSYLHLIVAAIEKRGEIDSSVAITVVLMLRVALARLKAAR